MVSAESTADRGPRLADLQTRDLASYVCDTFEGTSTTAWRCCGVFRDSGAGYNYYYYERI